MTGAWARRRAARRTHGDERGYVAVVTALVFVSFAFGCAALAVDVAKWWVEGTRVQKAADVAALAGVTYMPTDLASAANAAVNVSARNGYPDSGTSSVNAVRGNKPSQLRVSVCSTVSNSFGAALGLTSTKVCRTAVADYTGPAPMGSPCNTFGNEPTSGGTSSAAQPAGTAQAATGKYPTCTSRPQLWATIEGPATDKIQGDRFQTKNCSSSAVDGCAGTVNSEYRPEGYFFLVRVQPAAVNTPINLQLYDPAFTFTPNVPTQSSSTVYPCGGLPGAANWTNGANPYVNDAQKRYANADQYSSTTQGPYCTGDSYPGVGNLNQSRPAAVTTSFALRQQTDTQDPTDAPVQNDTNGTACIKQFRGNTTAPAVDDLTSTSTTYDDQWAQTFHNWYSLCTFKPTRAGDYYLQVRSNVSFDSTKGVANTKNNPVQISTGNTNVLADAGNTTAGSGNNAFSIRAVAPGYENQVAVSGYDRMPIYANADSATSTFNLIRVIPAGASKSIMFTFFDAGDASTTGTVQVIPPADAKTTGNNTTLTSQANTVQFPGGCRAVGGYAGTGANYADCKATIQGGSGGANNGKTETLVIPIPNDYTCTSTSLGGCWYQVKVSFAGGANVTDVTTWTAQITGDPVRLIE